MIPSSALLLVGAWHLNAAQAAGPLRGIPVARDTSTARYAADLVGGDAPSSAYAARVLLRRARSAWRLAVSDTNDIASLEARQILVEFDELVAPRCTRLVSQDNTVRACSIILGLLETKSALPILKERLEQPTTRCERRAVARAIERIEGSQ